MRRALRLLEFAVLYFGTPLALLWVPVVAERRFHVRLNAWVIPALLLLTLAVVVAARLRGALRFGELFACRGVPAREWARMLGRFAAGAALLAALLWWHDPAKLWVFPRTHPRFWLVVMACYPVFSVFAQGILYRWLFERRYAPVFPSRAASLAAGAVAFSFAHVLFRNGWALAFTLVGGVLFLSSYRRTRSVLFSDIEHALYGDFLFTVGWGAYFFEGTQKLAAAVAG